MPRQPRKSPPPAVASCADLSDLDHIITIRWDNDTSQPLLGLGGMNPVSAYALLSIAADSLWTQLAEATVEP